MSTAREQAMRSGVLHGPVAKAMTARQVPGQGPCEPCVQQLNPPGVLQPLPQTCNATATVATGKLTVGANQLAWANHELCLFVRTGRWAVGGSVPEPGVCAQVLGSSTAAAFPVPVHAPWCCILLPILQECAVNLKSATNQLKCIEPVSQPLEA